MLITKIKLSSIILFSFFLISCGGGGGSSSSGLTFVEVNAKELYSGQESQATLTKNNGMEFVKAVLNSFTVDLGGSTNLSGRPTNTSYNSTQARAVSETLTCDFGGSIDVNGDLNEETLLGVLNFDLNQCSNDGISTLTGILGMKINGFDVQSEEITSSIISMNNLMLQLQGQTQSVSGTETYDLDQSVETTVSNAIRIDVNGKQTLTENLILKETFQNSETDISGKIYLEDHGYVQISTTELLDRGFNGIPSLGEILVTGADNSKLYITAIALLNNNAFRITIDSNGDDIYEASSSITDINSIPLLLDDNLPPVIEAFSASDFTNVSSEFNFNVSQFDEPNFYFEFFGTDPEFSEFFGTDREFNKVTLDVSLISKPNDSITALTPSFNVDSYTISPDIAGAYIIEVIATDNDGVSSTRNYTINVSFF